ncbi:hypothetical protein F5H01DRAFT_338728 [Linnemannia elongata]|nr:hypothetical protein F5H01DRAFT_338728 [Linnemannia elongata]
MNNKNLIARPLLPSLHFIVPLSIPYVPLLILPYFRLCLSLFPSFLLLLFTFLHNYN